MSQSWKTDLLKEINLYFINYDESKAKIAQKKGYLTPDGKGKLKLTSSGEKFVEDVAGYLRIEKLKKKAQESSSKPSN